MKRYVAVLIAAMAILPACSDDGDSGTTPNVPIPSTLVAASRSGDIYAVNEESGADTQIIDTTTSDGQGGFVDVGVVSAMLYVPSTESWWLGTGGRATCQGCIQTLDPFSGVATTLHNDTELRGVSGLAVDPASGKIYSFESGGAGFFYEINDTTGEFTTLTEELYTGAAGNGTTFGRNGTLYVIGDSTLWRVDPSSLTAQPASNLTFTGFPPFQGELQTIGSLTTRPSDGRVFGLLLDGGGKGGVGPVKTYLVWIALGSGEVTNVGATTEILDGLAFIPNALIP